MKILSGSRVLVFDHTLYKDDKTTPLSVTLKPATVVCRYGYVSEHMTKLYGAKAGRYDDLIDVIFDHKPTKVSKGHFTRGVSLIE